MSTIPEQIITECKEKLIEMKSLLLEQLFAQRMRLADRVMTGDEGDLSLQALDETQMFASNQRIRQHLLEVEFALSRIERGTYGVCEETSEPIEIPRLRALPWTRFCIEGAELRDGQRRRRATQSSS